MPTSRCFDWILQWNAFEWTLGGRVMYRFTSSRVWSHSNTFCPILQSSEKKIEVRYWSHLVKVEIGLQQRRRKRRENRCERNHVASLAQASPPYLGGFVSLDNKSISFRRKWKKDVFDSLFYFMTEHN